MSYTDVVDAIAHLPHYREVECRRCGHKQQEYILVIQTQCANCGTATKLRRYAALGSEIEDVIDAALEWLGDGDDLAQAMKRKQIIDSSLD
jgi:ribosomal protein L37E